MLVRFVGQKKLDLEHRSPSQSCYLPQNRSSMKSTFSKGEARARARSSWADFLAGEQAATALALLADHLPTVVTKETRLLGTVAMADEADVLPILVATGLPVYAPVTRDEGRMEFRLLYDGGSRICPIEAGFRGVPGPHPKSALLTLPLGGADVAIVPSQATNGSGYRLGRGLGYYDRWRDALRNCKKLSVLPHELCGLQFEADSHDLKLDLAFTENGTVEY